MPQSLEKLDAAFKPLTELGYTVSRHLRSRLWAQILVAMVAGIATGVALSPQGGGALDQPTADTVGAWLALPGNLFLALIQMIVIPLVVTSIVLGIGAGEDPSYLRKVGLRIAPYFVSTTFVAVAIGIAFALVIEPGRFVDGSLIEAASPEHAGPVTASESAALGEQTLPDRIVGLIPQNPIGAAIEESMLQIVVFALLVGVALVSIPNERARPVLELLGSIQELSMKVVSWAMVIAPLAVFGLLAQIAMQVGIDALLGMGVYVATVLAGLLALVVVYLGIVTLLGRRSPLKFLSAVREAQLLAFSTSSSAAVMPLSIRTAEKKLGVSPSISQFVVPLGATVNMDGTALYQVVAAVFLTQVFGVDLSVTELILLTLTTVGASIGSPSTPGVGIVILATILQSVGVPASGVALIIGVDRILDMSRTAVNVTGDLTACVVLDRWLEPSAPRVSHRAPQ